MGAIRVTKLRKIAHDICGDLRLQHQIRSLYALVEMKSSRSPCGASRSDAAVVSGCSIELYHRLEFQSQKILKINMLSEWPAL
jgi:hypothetical protein